MSDGIRIVHVQPGDVVVFGNLGVMTLAGANAIAESLARVGITGILFEADVDITLLRATQIEEWKSKHAETLSRTAGQRPDQSDDAVSRGEQDRGELRTEAGMGGADLPADPAGDRSGDLVERD